MKGVYAVVYTFLFKDKIKMNNFGENFKSIVK